MRSDRRNGSPDDGRERAGGAETSNAGVDAPIDPSQIHDRDAASNAPLAEDPGAVVADNVEEGEVIYPSEIDALANGLVAEPGSAADREFHASEHAAEQPGPNAPSDPAVRSRKSP